VSSVVISFGVHLRSDVPQDPFCADQALRCAARHTAVQHTPSHHGASMNEWIHARSCAGLTSGLHNACSFTLSLSLQVAGKCGNNSHRDSPMERVNSRLLEAVACATAVEKLFTHPPVVVDLLIMSLKIDTVLELGSGISN
jgi:hypothetical protein